MTAAVHGLHARVAYTDHLVALVAEAAAASARLDAADPERLSVLVASARSERARLSARLDASPLTDVTADAVDAGTWTGARPPAAPAAGPGGWAQALGLDRLATQEVAAVEYANLLTVGDAEPELADALFDAPLTTLTRLHGLVCAGLVDPQVVGRPRRTAQAIADGAQGRVIYHAPDPAAVPVLLDELAAWLSSPRADGSAALPAVLVAAIVHLRLLEWQPFEAANGRLARAATRLVLRARGVDPRGAAVIEHGFADDPQRYYAEVAATIRRRGDLGRWLERHTEAVVAALRRAADVAAPGPAPAVPRRARESAAAWEPGASVTVTDYAAAHGVSRETAWAELRALERQGSLARQPGTRGLGYRRR